MLANVRVALAALCLTSALVACSSGSGGSGSGSGDGSGGGDGPATPTSIAVVAGDGQSAPGSTRLPRAPTVVVLDAGGGPVAGITVAFAIVDGGGSVDATSATTDEAGHASTGWTIGPAPGLNHLRASAAGVEAPVTFTAKAANTSPDVTLNLLEPLDGSTVGESIQVRATVGSTYQLATVTASIDGSSVELAYGYNSWAGTLSLAGKARGPVVLVVTATDIFGHLSDVVVPLKLDRYPIVTVAAPFEGTVARPSMNIVATCTDDDSTGCSSITASVSGTVVASGKDSLSQPVDFSAFEGQAVTLEIAGMDSAGQRTTVSRNLYVESSGHLSLRTELSGPACDVSGTRILFLDESGSTPSLEVLDTDSGSTNVLETAHSQRCKGVLTSRGAIYEGSYLWLREWRDGITTTLGYTDSTLPIRVAGDWAIYADAPEGYNRLVRRDLLAGSSTLVPNAIDGAGRGWLNDVASNGDVVYSDYRADIYRWRDGVTEQLTDDGTAPCDRPVTDGVYVAYVCHDVRLVVHDGVTASTVAERVYGFGHAVAGGYVAYATEDAARVPQIWRYRAGVSEQLSFFGSASTLDVLAPDGTVLFTSGGRRYRAAPGAPLEDIGSSLGTVILRDGKFFVFLGHTILEVGP